MATFISEVDPRIKLVGNNGDYYSPMHYVAVLEIEGKLLEVEVVREVKRRSKQHDKQY